MKKRTVQFTLSETDYQVLKMIAEGKGFGSIGKWAKEAIFTIANRQNPKGIMHKVKQMEQFRECPDTCPIVTETCTAMESDKIT